MFSPSDAPRLFGVPPGADFPQALLSGLTERASGLDLARVDLFVNTRRMERRLKALFLARGASLLPRIRLVTDLAQDPGVLDVLPAVPTLRRQLELSQLVAGLLRHADRFAPSTEAFDLAGSLAALLDEMQGEGVPVDAVRSLDVSDLSGHWSRTKEFLTLAQTFAEGQGWGAEARQRAVIERLVAQWDADPPKTPVIVAGSTGSRGATALLMAAVARLPQGAVVLPGLDFDMPSGAWDRLHDAPLGEDHPQYRFATLARGLRCDPTAIPAWTETVPNSSARTRLVSLALRPAPVTDQWLHDGQRMQGFASAVEDMQLIEAPSPRAEANAVALVVRDAAQRGTSVAVISPDRMLTRQVTSALDRWGILPDDSAGRPLSLSAPGRLLRQVAHLVGRQISADLLLALLKHPLVQGGTLHSLKLELWLRRHAPAFVTSADISHWAKKDAADGDWSAWLIEILERLQGPSEAVPLQERVDHHIALAELITGGDQGALWKEPAGEAALKVVRHLQEEAGSGGAMTAAEYSALFDTVLQSEEVREASQAHPLVSIWGTLEARVQGAELVVLAGLNEGLWPQPPRADPWFNRAMRARTGMLSPEREIGLSAHDFQQAVCARRVVLSRAVRDADAQTVPSRWLNRLITLLGGLGGEAGDALATMHARGRVWVDLAQAIDEPAVQRPAAPRPAPRPPVEMRPKEISITEVQRLIRDPYSVYAQRVLRLRALDPLRREPDAPLRGTVLHEIMETFAKRSLAETAEEDIQALMDITETVLQVRAGWPATRRLWRARLEKLSHWVVEGERARRAQQDPVALEAKARLALPNLDVTLTGQIDRIDRTDGSDLAIYDYKTGTVPAPEVRKHFDKQLLLSALLAERGAVKGLAAGTVGRVAYIGLSTNPKLVEECVSSGDVETVLRELQRLLASYQDPNQGYCARRAMAKQTDTRDYDHLSRFGEWDIADDPTPEDVT